MRSLLGSVRIRVTLAATLITAAVLILGAFAIIQVVEQNLTDSAHQEGSGQESADHESSDGSGELSEAAIKEIQDGVDAVTNALFIIIPGLIVILGVGTWLTVGRALRPVSVISGRVASITESTLDERIPVPDTDDEIAGLATLMNAMLDRLQTSADRQRRFTGDASHELRSPLATIKAAAEISQITSDEHRRVELAAEIQAEADRMKDLISDLLTLARLEDDTVEPAFEPVDTRRTCLAALERLQAGAIAVDTSIDEVLTTTGDTRALERAIYNLLRNAATHARTRIRLTAGASDSGVTIEVEDDGPGIPPDQRGFVFERFARADDARSRATGGTGLGLAIVKITIDNHGGSITADQSPDLLGARFTILLPNCP